LAPHRSSDERVLFSSCIVVMLLCAGAIWNAVALHHYRSIAGIPGKIYQVDGMPCRCFAQGPVRRWLCWKRARQRLDDLGKNQPELSKITKFARTIRAGFGWTIGPGVRDSNAIRMSCAGLLEQAGITGPIILMGHSMPESTCGTCRAFLRHCGHRVY